MWKTVCTFRKIPSAIDKLVRFARRRHCDENGRAVQLQLLLQLQPPLFVRAVQLLSYACFDLVTLSSSLVIKLKD